MKSKKETVAPKRVTLTPAQFWELRARQRDIETAQRQAQEHVNAAIAIANKALEAAGLTPGKNYGMDDADYSVTEQP